MKKLLILCLFFNVVTVYAENDWKIIKEKNGVVIYSLQKPDYKLKHFRAQITINKKANTILAVLQDTAACSKWVYNCITNQMVEKRDTRRQIYYTQIHSPLWFEDRDFYLQSDMNYNSQEKIFSVQLVSIPDYGKEIKDIFRIKEIELTWKLKHISDEITLVTYQVYIDPKLPIKSINHKIIEKSVFETMLGLKKMVNKPIYAEKKYSKSELEMLTEDN